MDEIKKYYDDHGKEWSESRVNPFFHENTFKKFLQYTESGDNILDIGSANGIHLPLFLGLGYKLNYEGIDISETLISIAQSRYPRESFLLGDILDRTTLPSRRYDGFWCSAVLMHVPKNLHKQMIENIQSLLKPGAYGYITLPERRTKELEPNDNRHFELFTQDEVVELFESHNWKLIDKGVLDDSPRNLWNWYIVQLP